MNTVTQSSSCYEFIRLIQMNHGVSVMCPREEILSAAWEIVPGFTHTGVWNLGDMCVEMSVNPGYARYAIRQRFFGGDLREVCYGVVCWDPAFTAKEWDNIVSTHRNTCEHLLSLPDHPGFDKEGLKKDLFPPIGMVHVLCDHCKLDHSMN